MWQEEPGDREGVIELCAIELSVYKKERERERKGESYEVSWLVANHLLSFIHPQTNSPRTNRRFFLSLARQIWLDGRWQPTIFQRSTEWEYGNLVNNMFTRSFEGMNSEHVDTELIYETVIAKHIKISATAVHLELSTTQLQHTLRLELSQKHCPTAMVLKVGGAPSGGCWAHRYCKGGGPADQQKKKRKENSRCNGIQVRE